MKPLSPKKYKKAFPYSYTLGPFPTFELLKTMPQIVHAVYFDEKFTEQEKLICLCERNRIPCSISPNVLSRIADKEICYAAAIFQKYETALVDDAPHIVLVHPSDMGNLGTILRTALALNFRDIAIIQPSADLFHPKTIRASMGAVFHMRTAIFSDFDEYLNFFGQTHALFPFTLQGGIPLNCAKLPIDPKFSLLFGNEASGLPPEISQLGQPIFIPQSDAVDSLNLAVSVAIGAYMFSQNLSLLNPI